MTRLWLEGHPITVEVRNETPHAFTWRGENHPVDLITMHWIVETDWWRIRIWRHYFKLSTHTGLLVVIFHDRHDEAWYLERLYD